MQDRLDALIPESFRTGDAEQYRRARMSMLISLISGATCFIFAWPNFLFWDLPESGVGLLVGAFICLVCIPIAFRLSKSLGLAAHLLTFVGSAILFFDAAMFSGGIYSSTMTWFVVPPMAASLMAGVRAGLFWTGVAIVSVLGVWWIEPPSPEALVGLRSPPFEHAAVSIGILVFAALLIVFYERMHAEAKAALVNSNRNLSLARDQAESASQAKSVFVAGISHELRTPLTSIRAHLEVLNTTSVSEELQTHLLGAFVASDSLQHLLEDLLDLSTMDSRGVILREAPYAVRGLLADVVLMLSETAKSKSLSQTQIVADDVPLVLIGDLARMRQLLLNLASNALKFTEEGGVEISVEIARADTIVFSVKDTGIGIGELDQKLIFDSFRQVDQGTTRQYGGVGMGLAVNRQLVEAMQGQITVESVLGEGTTFRVELPMQEGELPDTERAEENAASPAYLKALLVEDHELNRELLTEMLRLSGCEAIGTGSADEALDLLEAQQFDVVLMDLHMPGKDGADLTREWRKIESDLGRQSVRIIGISADVRLEERQRCSVAGMDDFLGKPFSLAALKEMLQAQRALGKRNP